MLRNSLLAACLFISAICWSQETTTFIFTRHAEKADDGTRDPGLTEEGNKRAERIAEVLSDVPVSAVYSTNYKRTLQTASPTAKGHGLTVLTYDPGDREFLNGLLEKEKGGTILISGHSNTIPNMINQLARTNYPNFSEEEYDNLVIVIIKPENDPLLIWLILN